MLTISAAGNVARPELRHTQAGDAVLGFSLAVNRGKGDQQTTVWLDCSVWGRRAEALAPHIEKGTKLAISGEGGEREYQANDGTMRKVLTVRVSELTFMGGGNQGDAQRQTGNGQRNAYADAKGRSSPASPPAAGGQQTDFDDEMPF